MLVLEIRDPRGAVLLQAAEQTWHSQGASQERLDGAWSFRPFVFILLSMAITSSLSLLGKGCQQVRSCFPRSKIIPVLPSLPSLWLFFFLFPLLPSSPFPFSPFLSCHFPSFYFPLLLSLSFLFPFHFFLFPLRSLFWEEEGSTCHSPTCDKLLFQVAGVQHLQHIPLKASCQHYQFSSFLPLLASGSTSTFLI